MSRAVPPITVSRPCLVDYLILLGGGALSLWLCQFNPLVATTSYTSPRGLVGLVGFLPNAMRLPEGIILVAPVFWLTQSMCGRLQSLTMGEWLGILAWIGVASLTALAGCRNGGLLPASFEAQASVPMKYWYLIVNPTMAGLALVLALLGFFARQEMPPWTHGLSLALVIWPVLPLGVILALGKFA